MAVYDLEPFDGESLPELAAYINRMNEKLQFILANIDEENTSKEYENRR